MLYSHRELIHFYFSSVCAQVAQRIDTHVPPQLHQIQLVAFASCKPVEGPVLIAAQATPSVLLGFQIRGSLCEPVCALQPPGDGSCMYFEQDKYQSTACPG